MEWANFSRNALPSGNCRTPLPKFLVGGSCHSLERPSERNPLGIPSLKIPSENLQGFSFPASQECYSTLPIRNQRDKKRVGKNGDFSSSCSERSLGGSYSVLPVKNEQEDNCLALWSTNFGGNWSGGIGGTNFGGIGGTNFGGSFSILPVRESKRQCLDSSPVLPFRPHNYDIPFYASHSLTRTKSSNNLPKLCNNIQTSEPNLLSNQKNTSNGCYISNNLLRGEGSFNRDISIFKSRRPVNEIIASSKTEMCKNSQRVVEQCTNSSVLSPKNSMISSNNSRRSVRSNSICNGDNNIRDVGKTFSPNSGNRSKFRRSSSHDVANTRHFLAVFEEPDEIVQPSILAENSTAETILEPKDDNSKEYPKDFDDHIYSNLLRGRSSSASHVVYDRADESAEELLQKQCHLLSLQMPRVKNPRRFSRETVEQRYVDRSVRDYLSSSEKHLSIRRVPSSARSLGKSFKFSSIEELDEPTLIDDSNISRVHLSLPNDCSILSNSVNAVAYNSDSSYNSTSTHSKLIISGTLETKGEQSSHGYPQAPKSSHNSSSRSDEDSGTISEGRQNHQIDTKSHPIDSKVDQIYSKVDQIDSNVDQIDSKVDQINSNVYTIDSKVDKIDSKIDEIDSKVDKIDSKVDQIDTKDQIDSKVDQSDSKVDSDSETPNLDYRPLSEIDSSSISDNFSNISDYLTPVEGFTSPNYGPSGGDPPHPLTDDESCCYWSVLEEQMGGQISSGEDVTSIRSGLSSPDVGF